MLRNGQTAYQFYGLLDVIIIFQKSHL